MKKYLSLVKLLFVQQYRIKPMGESKGKKVGTIIAFVVLGLCLLPMIISMIAGSYILGTISGRDESVCALLILICQGLVFIFGLAGMLTMVFDSRDGDRLLFLPVKPVTIFMAKMTVVYLNETITTAVTALALLLPFGIGSGATVNFYLMLPIVLLLLPVLPLVLGGVLAIPFSLLMAKIKNNGLLKTIMSIVFFVIVMGAYLLLISGLSQNGDLENIDDMTAIVALVRDALRNTSAKVSFIHCNLMLAVAMMTTTFGNWGFGFLTTVVENAAMFGLLVLFALPFYRWILSASLESTQGAARKGQGKVQLKNRGVLKELVLTDFKRTVRNSQMGFQMLGGLVMLPLLMVVMAFAFNQGDGGVSLVEELSNDPLYKMLAPIVIVLYASMMGMTVNMMGIFPISRENKSLYLLKSLPVPFGKILLSKVVLATAVMVVTDILTCIVSVVAFSIPWYYIFGMVIVMALLCFGAMCITTLVDLKSPKLGWTTFQQGLKNAKNNWIAMLVGAIVLIAVGLVATAFVLIVLNALNLYAAMIAVMWLVLMGVSVAFAIVSYKIMVGKATKYFERIEL